MLEKFKQRFVEEVIELLNNLEKTLLLLEKNTEDNELISEVFRIMHTIKGSAGMYDLKKTVELTHKLETIYAHYRDYKTSLSKKITTLTFQSIDYIRELITVDSENNVEITKINKFISLIDKQIKEIEGTIDSKNINNKDKTEYLYLEDENSGIEIFETKEIDSKKIINEFQNSNSNENSIIDNYKTFSEQKRSYIKVASEKLDELMNLVSELVTTKAELMLEIEPLENEKLNGITEKIEKITTGLRNNALNIRLIPIESVLLRFERLVRDLAFELGKKIEFITEGTDTELDKNIIDNLSVPLMHIVRNAIDHGIENEEKRQKLGKKEIGIIRFIAFYSGANVLIQIQDDGAGINPSEIKLKAIEKGYITKEQNLTTKEIYDLIFLPGFSTAQTITGISGRGIGMDIVKQTINDLRGEIEINSEIHKGTTVTIKLPLTLSLIDTLLVITGNTKILIPLSNIESCGQILHSKLIESFNNKITYNQELIPYIYLREKFLIEGDIPEYESIIFVRHKNNQIALVFDNIIGEHQAVLKSLGNIFVNQEFISGASILGDGSVALVLDTNKLINRFC
jgi:two-component system chemotaxis sensor kinase CheA